MDDLMKAHDSADRGRILVADDDELFRSALMQWLEGHQYKCTGAANAATAMACLQASPFDALISDIHMPGNVGLELIEQVPQVAAGLPVFLLTGRPTLETAARSVRLSAAAYLIKPPNFKELDQLLQEAITSYRHVRLINQSQLGLRDWNAQLEALALSLRQRAKDSDDKALADYLHLTLRNVLLQLADLERTTAAWQREKVTSGDLQQLDLIGALRRTVEVLEQTKHNFKCKQLADLRRQIEVLLDSR